MTLEGFFYKYIIPVLIAGVVFFFLERKNAIEKDQKYFKSEMGQDLSLFFFNAGLVSPLAVLLLYPLIHTALIKIAPYQFFDQSIQTLPFIAQILLGVFILDFIIYWRHRFTHHFMWRFHGVHHNAKEMSRSTKLRLHPVDLLTAIAFQITFLYFLGFSGGAIAWASLIIAIVDYWNHANFKFGFNGPLRFIFSTPKYHRWHHAAETAAVNKNYVVCFPFIDLMFGTYYQPVDRYPKKIGFFDKANAKLPKSIIGQFLYPFKPKQ